MQPSYQIVFNYAIFCRIGREQLISTFRELTLHANDKLHHGVLFRLFNWVIIARKNWKWCAMKIWSVCEPEDIWWNGEMMQDDDFRLPFCFLQEVMSHTILSFTRKEKKYYLSCSWRKRSSHSMPRTQRVHILRYLSCLFCYVKRPPFKECLTKFMAIYEKERRQLHVFFPTKKVGYFFPYAVLKESNSSVWLSCWGV